MISIVVCFDSLLSFVLYIFCEFLLCDYHKAYIKHSYNSGFVADNSLTSIIYKNCCCHLVAQSCLTLSWPSGLKPTRLHCPWDFPGKNAGVGYHFLLQGIFSTQGSKPHLLQVSCIAGRFFTTEPLGKPPYIRMLPLYSSFLCFWGHDYPIFILNTY